MITVINSCTALSVKCQVLIPAITIRVVSHTPITAIFIRQNVAGCRNFAKWSWVTRACSDLMAVRKACACIESRIRCACPRLPTVKRCILLGSNVEPNQSRRLASSRLDRPRRISEKVILIDPILGINTYICWW